MTTPGSRGVVLPVAADGGGRTRATADVSIIVPFAEAAPYIERAIEALLAQRYPRERYEVILVDNDSADGSAGLARRHPGVTVLSEPRRGAYAARNRGLAAASGAIVAFTDADCAPSPDWLSTMAAALEDPRVAVALGRVVSPPSPSLALVSAYEHQRALYIFGAPVPALYYGYTNNMAVRREVIDAVGPFEEVARGADVVFVRRAAEALGPDAVRYVPGALVEHLEMTGAGAWLRKMFIYGQSSRYYRAAPAARALTGAERLRLFRATVGGMRGGIADRARLFALLSAGVALHRLGRWSASPIQHA